MSRFFSKRRLKIAEQIIIVMFFAVIIPMTISGLFINNINQHSNRAQLRDAAIVLANIVAEEVEIFKNSIDNELSQIGTTVEYYNSPELTDEYLNTIKKDMHFYKELRLIKQKDLKNFENYELNNDYLVYKKELSNGDFLTAVIDIKILRDNIYKTVDQDKRQIYVLAGTDNKLLASVNYKEDVFKSSLEQLPKKLVDNKSTIFGKIKNQPLAYYKKTDPDITIIVNTTEDVTRHLIDNNRDRIILAVLLTMLAVFFVVGLYTSYLYTNIRQLFKAIIAISKGNYARRIRLLTNIFTPFEIVFLGNEFNRMVSQIHKSYIQLNKKNKELKQLNEFRSNMIDTVSHEFRTPLTCIQGYTSRLMRRDIEIDEETKQKSLKIIKKQTERLKRMIEDILVIPEIDGSGLNFEIQPINIATIVENVITLVNNDKGKVIINNLSNCNIDVLADADRLEQVFVNLTENAIKYSKDETPVVLDYEMRENRIVISVKNDYDIIPREKLKTLFDKFTRIDDSTTRTTRGTGLGLYIVKGLVEAMGGEIRIYSNEECGFCVKVYLPLAIKEEIYE
ncbi:MAG: HAMP domain-containing histidine kinase [bacterium]|nr:HAMP domain-containing histidine kinase [bacterium]